MRLCTDRSDIAISDALENIRSYYPLPNNTKEKISWYPFEAFEFVVQWDYREMPRFTRIGLKLELSPAFSLSRI